MIDLQLSSTMAVIAAPIPRKTEQKCDIFSGRCLTVCLPFTTMTMYVTIIHITCLPLAHKIPPSCTHCTRSGQCGSLCCTNCTCKMQPCRFSLDHKLCNGFSTLTVCWYIFSCAMVNHDNFAARDSSGVRKNKGPRKYIGTLRYLEWLWWSTWSALGFYTLWTSFLGQHILGFTKPHNK